MDDEDRIRRADRVRLLLESKEWQEAWAIYRDRLLSMIEGADSDATDQVMQAKRMLVAGHAAKAHLEALMTDGKIAAEQIKFDKARNTLFGRRNA